MYVCTYSPADPFDDFVPVVHDIVFGPDTLDHHIVYIPIVNDDDCVEPIEAFNVHIDSDMDCVDFISRYATINIVDDDGEHHAHTFCNVNYLHQHIILALV